MKEKMKTVEENIILPKAPWITFSVDTEYRELFENFCNRNQIPFEEVYTGDQEITGMAKSNMIAKMAQLESHPAKFCAKSFTYAIVSLMAHFMVLPLSFATIIA